MFNQFSNIRSKYCNTDIHGLRFNELKNQNKECSIFDQFSDDKKDGALIIGNSLAFGEGRHKTVKLFQIYYPKIPNIIFLILA